MAITDLGKLLAEMSPEVGEEKYFLACVPQSQLMVLANYVDYINCIYWEEEGLTVLFSQKIKEEIESVSSEKIAGPFALITLAVNSDLFAVGFLARVSEVLAKEKISINAFSAYHHDHILVPYEKKKEAMAALENLSSKL